MTHFRVVQLPSIWRCRGDPPADTALGGGAWFRCSGNGGFRITVVAGESPCNRAHHELPGGPRPVSFTHDRCSGAAFVCSPPGVTRRSGCDAAHVDRTRR
jgi:hypothetical protein